MQRAGDGFSEVRPLEQLTAAEAAERTRAIAAAVQSGIARLVHRNGGHVRLALDAVVDGTRIPVRVHKDGTCRQHTPGKHGDGQIIARLDAQHYVAQMIKQWRQCRMDDPSRDGHPRGSHFVKFAF